MQEFKKHRSEKQSSDTQIKSGNDVLLLHRKFADSLSSHEMTHLCVHVVCVCMRACVHECLRKHMCVHDDVCVFDRCALTAAVSKS